MIEIREEKISEQRETENVVREAFWNAYSPGCSDHYLVHQIRQCPAYIPQLNLVAVKNETIVGHVINIKSYISEMTGEITRLSVWDQFRYFLNIKELVLVQN